MLLQCSLYIMLCSGRLHLRFLVNLSRAFLRLGLTVLRSPLDLVFLIKKLIYSCGSSVGFPQVSFVLDPTF